MYSSPSAAIRLSAWTLLNRMGAISLYGMVKLAWLIGGLYAGLVMTMMQGVLGGMTVGVLGFVAGTVGGVLLGLLNAIVCVLFTIVAFRPLHAPRITA